MSDEYFQETEDDLAHSKSAYRDAAPTAEPERHWAEQFRLEDATVGKEVNTPAGPGKIIDVWDDGRSCQVQLEQGGIRPYRTNRLTLLKPKVASKSLSKKALDMEQALATNEVSTDMSQVSDVDDSPDVEDLLDSTDLFADDDEYTPSQHAGVDNGLNGRFFAGQGTVR